jgi:hypothetical protein
MTGISSSTTSYNAIFPVWPTRAAGESDLYTQATACVPNEVFWRKQLILRRGALECQWHQLFPRHSFADLRLIAPPNSADFYWSGQSWKRAAQAYHQERRKFR